MEILTKVFDTAANPECLPAAKSGVLVIVAYKNTNNPQKPRITCPAIQEV